MLDFVNDTEEVLAAFKTYHTTAELSATHRSEPRLQPPQPSWTRPGTTMNLKWIAWWQAELKPDAKQSELVAAIGAGGGPPDETLQGGPGGVEDREGEEG